MSTERIGDFPAVEGWQTKKGYQQPCERSDHYPPTHMVWPSGRYRHTCPGCGHVLEFSVYPTFHVSTA